MDTPDGNSGASGSGSGTGSFDPGNGTALAPGNAIDLATAPGVSSYGGMSSSGVGLPSASGM